MSVSFTEDFKSVSDLKKKTREVFEQIHRTGRPIIITVNGKPDAVLLDAEVFEKKLKALNLGVLLNEAEAEVKKENTRPARDFLKEFKHSAKVSG
ncbi:prevent-host-death protein [Peptococcaceae bacterium SCADC1_2_3]|jgi:prevent-host-death family protein|nr:prevent-host-death protein [Peptococcaceae bacterium SCADC1_2_3]HBQ29192.1 type II toxin-antitoxin system Phd/YefM family antitoxin [Desulfotomaculum sp.]KFI35412.1 prevent-host-death protein [Peptococcaceae bacterium SCADC1_2_3]KFI36627.1 prevent-host-death protein [Peptococcaceae bacterium SCADC1_2_3]KFI37839.1 prevent-host-death protein [Peptococcaceae bacterium SCADC1_2_3]